MDASDLNSEVGEDTLEEGDATIENLRGNHEDNEVGVGTEEEDNFSTVVVAEDISTVVGGDEGVDDAATARPSLWHLCHLVQVQSQCHCYLHMIDNCLNQRHHRKQPR